MRPYQDDQEDQDETDQQPNRFPALSNMIGAAGNYIGDKMQHANDISQSTFHQMKDRLAMSNPNVQGPRLPDITPEEQEQSQNMMGAVMGSLREVPQAVIPGRVNIPSPLQGKLEQAKSELNNIYNNATNGSGDNNLKDVRFATDKVSRLMDMIKREKTYNK